ncbi:MAG: hypothetical protein DCC75_13485 [Proteobacteria bacterium]|nr:MAG: hypothetical protein DCC75_13485 [Pseudomonadota bacterium]
MDQAGNILYADSVSLIPPQYRNQVLKPTPQPTYKPGFKPKTPTDSTLRKKKNPPKKKKDRRKPIPGNSAPYTDNF